MIKGLKDCTSFCPVCNSDIAYSNLECQCKNPDCSWSCDECMKTNIEMAEEAN